MDSFTTALLIGISALGAVVPGAEGPQPRPAPPPVVGAGSVTTPG